MTVYAQENSEANHSVTILGERRLAEPDRTILPTRIITAKDIREVGVDSVNEAITQLGGVYARQSVLGEGDAHLDLMGFGANSVNNLVVLIDGVRLSENEQMPAFLSNIPIDSVASIEVQRSSDSVRYGEGATGGVIKITTKTLGVTPVIGSIVGGIGQFHEKSLRLHLSKGWEHTQIALHLRDQHTDNYRDNNALHERNAEIALTSHVDTVRWGIKANTLEKNIGLPGALTWQAFEANPKQTVTPEDYSHINRDHIMSFIEKNGDNWQVGAALSTKYQHTNTYLLSSQLEAMYQSRQTTLSPYMQYIHKHAYGTDNWVMGGNINHSHRQTRSVYSLAHAKQASYGLYTRYQRQYKQMQIGVGARHERFSQHSDNPLPNSVDNYIDKNNSHAWEAVTRYQLSSVVVLFGQVSRSYRVANVDDNAYTLSPGVPLLPQISRDIEWGTTIGHSKKQMTLRWFQHNLHNEIYFNPLANNGLGANVNLDPTRRDGVALIFDWQWLAALKLSVEAQHVRARFVGGAYAGKQLALVPNHTVFARLHWKINNASQWYARAKWVDKQPYGSDFSNNCPAMMPSHFIVDMGYLITYHDWELRLQGSNLTNQSYFTYAYGCRSGIYPDATRQVSFRLRHDF